MRTKLFMFFSIILWNCKSQSKKHWHLSEMHNILVFKDFDKAINVAQKTNKNIFVIGDSPYTGCCKKEIQKTFDYLNKHLDIVEEYHIVYINLDEKKSDQRENSREQFISLTGQITSYYFFTIDKNARVLKQQDLEIETKLALDKIFEK